MKRCRPCFLGCGLGCVVALWCAVFALATELQLSAKADHRYLTNRVLTLFSTDKGLPSSDANDVLQTRDGYLWVASYGGLLRYDGWNFYNYSHQKEGIPTSSIRVLFEDSLGRLWAGSNNMGAFVYEKNAFTSVPAEDPALFQSIRSFAEDAAGTLYVGTTNGLATVGPAGTLVGVSMDAMEKRQIRNLSVDDNGAVWGVMDPGVVFCYYKGKVVYKFAPGQLSPHTSTAVLAGNGKVFIGTDKNTLVILDFSDSTYAADSFQMRTISTGDIQNHNRIFRTEEGELWLCGDVGYGWFDAEMELHTLDTTEEQVRFVVSGTEDYEGNIWLASIRGGLYRVASGKFYTTYAKAGLKGLSVNAITRAKDLLYVSSDSGLAIVDKNWNPVYNALTTYLANERIRSGIADSKGELWFSTYSPKGLVRYTPATGAIRSISEKDGLLSNKVRTTLELRNGDIAVASSGGLNIVRDGLVVAQYCQQDGFINPTILCLLELADGTLLAGSDGQGIYAIRDGKVSVIGKENGLSIGTVLRMREDSKAEGLWIAAGDRLFFMDKNRQVRAINAFRQGAGSIFDIQVGDDTVRLLKSDGVRQVSREDLLLDQKIDVMEYGSRSGLHADLVANSWNMREGGDLFLCTSDGISILPQTPGVQKKIPPKTVINTVLMSSGDAADAVQIDHPGNVVLAKHTRRVTIVFAGLTFGLVPSTMEYMLEGFDKTPTRVQAGAANAVSYTNLPGGHYSFWLRAINADGVESAGKTVLHIEKELRFYESPWFWVALGALALLLAGLLIYVVVRVKTRNMQRRQQEYKDITDQALRTIAQTIDAKDSYTNGHSLRVAEYAGEIARRLGMNAEEQEKIYYIGLLHDIGKVGIPDAILNKPAPLTEAESVIMRRHTTIGAEILKNFKALPDIGLGALCHHEYYRGHGYPNGTEGELIPKIGRIICVADAYDAMATKRAYQPRKDRDYIISELEKNSGTQFDPEIARVMIDMLRETTPER